MVKDDLTKRTETMPAKFDAQPSITNINGQPFQTAFSMEIIPMKLKDAAASNAATA